MTVTETYVERRDESRSNLQARQCHVNMSVMQGWRLVQLTQLIQAIVIVIMPTLQHRKGLEESETMRDIGREIASVMVHQNEQLTCYVTSHWRHCDDRGRRQKVLNAREKTTATNRELFTHGLSTETKPSSEVLHYHHHHHLSAEVASCRLPPNVRRLIAPTGCFNELARLPVSQRRPTEIKLCNTAFGPQKNHEER